MIAPPVVDGVVKVSALGELEYIDQNQSSPIAPGSRTTYLQAHIDLSASIDLSTNGIPYQWSPLGSGVLPPPSLPVLETTSLPSLPSIPTLPLPILPIFSGTFNGEGHTIEGWVVNDASAQVAGFFGVVSGTIKNLGVRGTVHGGSTVGGLVGSAQTGSSITFSYSAASVSGNRFIGGLVGGQLPGSTIEDTYVTGDVTGTLDHSSSPGGLVSSDSVVQAHCSSHAGEKRALA